VFGWRISSNIRHNPTEMEQNPRKIFKIKYICDKIVLSWDY
jgi:hypothetical protein